MSTLQQSIQPGWNIVGHEHAIDLLRRTLAVQQVRHAYLFTGPDHIGKALLVHRFAQTLLCTGGPDPQVAPEAPCNVCIIQGAHEMNLQAANCLLKTLEEPEPDVVLLLTAPDAGLLLPTILSRVQQVPMHLLTAAQIEAALEKTWSVDTGEAALIAALAAGRMGWAVQAVEDEDLLIERRTQLETLAALPRVGNVQRFEIAQRLSADPEKTRAILELWLLWWRDMVLAAHKCLDLTVNVDMRHVLEQQAATVGMRESERMVHAILDTMEALDQNVNTRAALEVLMLDVPKINTM